MYKICPKCGYERPADARNTSGRCPRCDLVFSKWLKYRFRITGHQDEAATPITQRLRERLKHGIAQLLLTDTLVGKGLFYLYLLIYLLVLIGGIRVMFSDLTDAAMSASFLHLVHLVFHEAGHLLFRVFGRFMMVAGGSLMQMIVPASFLFYFLIKRRDNFAASVSLWWLAHSVMDLVHYIDDASRQELWLLGGVQGKDMPGIHDWNNLLTDMGLLEYDHALARLSAVLGRLLMVLSLLWGGLLLKKLRVQERDRFS